MPNTKWVAKKVLSPRERYVFSLFLEREGPEVARDYLLGEVDHRLRNGYSSFAEAAEYYNLLMVPQERVLQFPQT
ncbi:MAG: hypothetical protein NUV60_02765 [Patescibacteria group bacterium]|nr:hypothetical protein [Patescibacteria group bacterium]